MEDWLLGDSNQDSEGSDGSDLSIDEIVAAFREALMRERGKLDEGETPAPSEETEEPDAVSEQPFREEELEERTPPPSADSEGSSGEAPRSPSSKVEDTIAAFRRARRQKEQQKPRDEGAEERREEEPTKPSAEEPPEEPRKDEDRAEGRIEDFAPAFRDALRRRGEAGEEEASDEPDERAEEEEAPREPEVRGPGRSGDGVPPSERVEVSESSGSRELRDPPRTQPPRGEENYLWVTDRPEDDASSISVENLGARRAVEADAFLLRGRGARPYQLLTRIRGHSNANIYLKPVFWMRSVDEESKVTHHVDGEWSREEPSGLDSLHQRARSINQRVRNLVGGGIREESGMELRVLRFMASRGHEFEPQRTADNPDGFVYPKLTPIVDRESASAGGELVQVLSILEERRLLTGQFVMRQHACHNCGSAFLNFEEKCPHCGSTDLESDDLVHHFRCAFTGPLREFKREKGRLVCPKCDRALKQIGVDYDKPSVVHTCHRCHEQFQDPEVQTTCYQCEHTNPPEQQIERQIKKYDITALGEETAIYGLSDSLLSILERESRVLDYATFQLIVESEAARIERYQRSASSLLMVRLAGLKQLRAELGQRSQEVVEEIASAFDNTLRSSDYLSARDESLYLFLLTETDEQGARRAGERLEENIEGVLGQNLKHPPELQTGVEPLRPDIDLDSVAEDFLAARNGERRTVPAG